jgi:hypothetical protein
MGDTEDVPLRRGLVVASLLAVIGSMAHENESSLGKVWWSSKRRVKFSLAESPGGNISACSDLSLWDM